MMEVVPTLDVPILEHVITFLKLDAMMEVVITPVVQDVPTQ